MAASETHDDKEQQKSKRTVVIAIDESEQAVQAFLCKIFKLILLSFTKFIYFLFYIFKITLSNYSKIFFIKL